MENEEPPTILQILWKLKKIRREQLEEALSKDFAKYSPIEEVIRRGWATSEDLCHARAIEFGMDVHESLEKFRPPEEILEKISYSFVKKHQAFPIRLEGENLIVAISDPLNLHVIDELRHLFRGKNIHTVYSPKNIIMDTATAHYKRSKGKAKNLIEKTLDKTTSQKESAYDLLDEENDVPVIKFLNAIISEAIQQKASDIHFDPLEDGLKIRYRIDGVLHNRHSPPRDYQRQIITRLKVMSKLDIAERRLPQDGRTKLSMGGQEIDFRISTVPVINGERVVLRILDRKNVLLGLDKLGMNANSLKTFRKFIRQPEGIILVTGPTGSGKTTTLYSSIQEIYSEETNIMTIEDPIEYKLASIAQISVRPKIDLTFAKGLRHILRQDPDIIMIGEIRDRETAEIAIQASLTGHLVLSTLHTNDAPSAITRLIEMGIEPYLLSSSIIGVIAQRLLRKVCSCCKRSYLPSDEELKEIGLERHSLIENSLYLGEGCHSCFGSGYKGRHGIYEMMPVSGSIKKRILQKSNAEDLRKISLKEKMIPLRNEAAELARKGISTAQEALRITRNMRTTER